MAISRTIVAFRLLCIISIYFRLINGGLTVISTGKGMLRQVSDNSNAHVLLHANDVIRVCRLCDHIDSISTLIDNCQIGTTGCYCLSPSAYFIDIQNKSAVTWKITENCFQAKVSLPEFRRFQMTFVWRTAARYFADDSDVMLLRGVAGVAAASA